nr:MAG TPA: hypothetical protein [Caudoviricetes sp.]
MVSSTPRWVASYGSSPCAGIFVFKERLWKKKIIVVHVNGMQRKKAYAVMAIVNIGQISDALMIVVNAGRVLKMRKQEIIYIAVDNKDADCFLDELCKPGIITDSYLRVDRKKKTLETSNYQVIAISLSDFCRLTPISPVKYYLYSNEPFTTQLVLLENRYNELQLIKIRLSTSAKEMDMKMLIGMLNGVRE